MVKTILPNFGLPNKQQWENALDAAIFSFVSAFLSIFTANGGLNDILAFNLTLLLSAGTAGFNAFLYTIFVILFKKS